MAGAHDRSTDTNARACTARPLRGLIASLVVAWAAGVGSIAWAQDCQVEVEPNDTPAEATSLGDKRCFVGELDDQQDAWVWEVGPDEAATRWVVEIEGIEDQLTQIDLIDVAFADDGVGVTAADRMWQFGTTDGRPNASDPILLGEGTLHIGISKSGGSGRYVVHLRPEPLPRGYATFDRTEEASGAFSAYGPLPGDAPREIAWTVGEEDADLLWGVGGATSIDGSARIVLDGPDGEIASGEIGPGTVGENDFAMAFLGLDAGEHRLRVEGDAKMATVRVVPQGRPTDGSEVEPNDDMESANLMDLDAPFEGAAEGSDWIVVDVPEDRAEEAFDLMVDADDSIDITLRDDDGAALLERRGTGGSVPGLVLGSGRTYIEVEGRGAPAYRLEFVPGDAPRDGFEVEPNDRFVAASPMSDEATLRGSASPQDIDILRFEAEAGSWRVQAIGDGVEELEAFDAGGRSLGSTSGAGRLRLDNVVLASDTAYLRIEGDGDYAVRAIRLGPPPEPPEPAADDTEDEELEPADAAAPSDRPSEPEEVEAPPDPGPPPPPGWVESEPNDDAARAELLRAGVTRVGTLTDRDSDHYRFTLENDAYVRIEAVPPENGRLLFDVSDIGRATAEENGETSVMETRMLAGDYTLNLRADEASDGWYQLRLTFLDPIALPDDVEPNDGTAEAATLPADLDVEGRVGTMGDEDYYRLPDVDRPTELRIDAELDGATLRLSGDASLEELEDGSFRAELQPDAPAYLRLSGRGDYRLRLALDPSPDAAQLRPPSEGTGLELASSLDTRDLAAYWREGQTLSGELQVENSGSEARDVTFEAEPSLLGVAFDLPDETRIGAGERLELPYQVRLPDDLRDDQPLRITLGARSDDAVATDGHRLTPICEAAPLAPFHHVPVPEPLVGHLNVAWAPLGATVVDSESGSDEYLNDGWTSPGRGAARAPGDAFVLDLPGDEPIRLTGTLLHPQSRQVTRQVRRFAIDVSLDGETFEPVMEDRLEAARVEQGWTFDRQVEARYVRLRVLDAHGGGTGNAWIGEWKVLADEPDRFGPFDLADTRLGGALTWSDPGMSGNALLPGVERNTVVDGREIDEASFVVGFQHGRAAQIDRLAWAASDQGGPDQRFAEVRVDVSVAGPVGPWKELGTWALDDGEGTPTTRIELDEPVWARYVRFTAGGHDPDESRVAMPATVHVYERPAGDGYRSILGAWGHSRTTGPYEASLAAQAGPAPVRVDDDGSDDTRDGAREVGDGDVTEGTVLVAEDEDWYRIDVPEGSNMIELRLDADPGTVRHAFTDAEGDPVVHDLVEDGAGATLTAFVEPGSYYLHLDEPKRSVAFVWDSSGSMGPFLPITNASVSSFARDVDEDRESVQMVVFDDPDPLWLLPYWSGDREYVGRNLARFDPASVGSSNAELAMLSATQGLADREGTRAILLITDHESPGHALNADLWRAIDEVRPRVFTFEVSSGGSGVTQDRMQAYAAANQGVYDYARNVGDFDMGFRRASCNLRRPKAYTLEVAVEYQEPPGPGQLSVERGSDAELPGVEVIFDASGSMGSNLPDGTSRIDAARDVLGELVGEILPEGTPFALRAFGHITPQSCESRLEIPFEPLDRDAAFAAIGEIQPKLLSQTPIADALRQVAGDLGEADGSSVIVITDGEESCDGDPAAALEELREQGIDVNLSIVTLGVESEEVRAGFEALAERASGTYAAADDLGALRDEVERALYPAFEVLGPDGAVVATGRIGSGSVELPLGVYTVRIPGSPPALIRDVRVPGDGSVSVTAP